MATIRWKVLLLLVLCSCVAQRAKDTQQEVATPQFAKLAAPPPGTDSLSLQPADTVSLIPVEAEEEVRAAPDSILTDTTAALQQRASMAPKVRDAARRTTIKCPPCPTPPKAEVIFRENEALADSLRHELQTEKLANTGFRERLKKTEAERDYWREKNRQKRWSLIFMGIFGALFIAFKLLASQVRVNEG